LLRAFLILLSFITDHETVTDIGHGAFTLGLVNVSLLCCIGIGLAVRYWLVNRSQADSAVRRDQ
jgi:hypothetical protein